MFFFVFVLLMSFCVLCWHRMVKKQPFYSTSAGSQFSISANCTLSWFKSCLFARTILGKARRCMLSVRFHETKKKQKVFCTYLWGYLQSGEVSKISAWYRYCGRHVNLPILPCIITLTITLYQRNTVKIAKKMVKLICNPLYLHNCVPILYDERMLSDSSFYSHYLKGRY